MAVRELQCFVTKAPLEAGLITTWNGPYSGGDDVSIPANTKLLASLDIPKGATAICATPLNYECLEEQLVDSADRASRKYRGYYLVIDLNIFSEQTEAIYRLPATESNIVWSGQNISLSKIKGCLMASALGDAVGLNYEGLSRQRMKRYAEEIDRHKLLFGARLFSDDTEHHLLTAIALIHSMPHLDQFRSKMGWSLRKWVLALPPATGMATLKACIKLCIGFPPKHSGVFSAGNGPMMRAGILGLICGENPEQLLQWIQTNTTLTHRDPLASYTAFCVAAACYLDAKTIPPSHFYQLIKQHLPEDNASKVLLQSLNRVVVAVEMGQSETDFIADNGFTQGVTGYSVHTLKAVLYIYWNQQGDIKSALEKIISWGGDTDTSAAILGAIMGAQYGEEKLPSDWISSIHDWPLNPTLIDQVAVALWQQRNNTSHAKVKYPTYLKLLIRNLLFMVLVLFHGFKRLIPGL